MNDSYLIVFKAISNCVKDLGESFGTRQRSLLLYKHLVEKTTIVHEEPIKKHILAWKNFCEINSDAILENNYEKINTKVEYSEKVFLDIGEIFKIADKAETSIIWKHLLTIHAFLDPTSKAKEMLKKSMDSGGKEDAFLHNIIDQVEQHVDPTANPMEAVNSIMSSGLFSNLVQGMNTGITEGSMDLGKLLQSVNGMISSLGQMANDPSGGTLPPEMSQMTSMLDTMMKSVPSATGMPGMPAMPGMSAMSAMSAMPDMPGMSAMPTPTTMPAIKNKKKKKNKKNKKNKR